MIISKKLFSTVVFFSCFATSAAHAGPSVTVTFRHVGTVDSDPASYVITNSNETSTRLNANPKPETVIKAGDSDTYRVQSTISPDVNYASARYTIGGKTCVFSTTFVRSPGAGGVTLPKWKKTATPSGGATCTATITSTNVGTREWAVLFTMR